MVNINSLYGKFEASNNKQVSQFWTMGCLQEYIQRATCPHHNIEDSLLTQCFYHGLTNITHSHLDAIIGGAFFSLNVSNITHWKYSLRSLVDGELLQPKKWGMHTINEVDMLSTKLDLLMKKI